MRHVILAIVVPFATLVISFILTNVAYMLWADWRYPQTSSMAGLSAFVLGLWVAPICALISGIIVMRWISKKEAE
jgi:uncharacterized oligopeptide transporter (OPT) family protein